MSKFKINDIVLVPVDNKKQVGIIKFIGSVIDGQSFNSGGIITTGHYAEFPVFSVYIKPTVYYNYLEKDISKVSIDPDVARQIVNSYGGILEG